MPCSKKSCSPPRPASATSGTGSCTCMMLATLLATASGLVSLTDETGWGGEGDILRRRCVEAPWVQRFNATQHAMLAGLRPPRLVVVRPHGRGGLGNRLRAINAALYVAVLTDRALVLDYGADANATEAAYLLPNVVQWDWSAAAPAIFARVPKKKKGGGLGAAVGEPLTLTWLPPNGVKLEEADARAAFLSATGGHDVLVADSWNQEPTTRLQQHAALRAAALEAGLGPDLLGSGPRRDKAAALYSGCAAHVLYKPSPTLAAEVVAARRAMGLEYAAPLGAALHLRTNVEFNVSYGGHDKCHSVECWRAVGKRMRACARGIEAEAGGEPMPWLVASDEHALVDALREEVEEAADTADGRHAWRAVALPSESRTHSGLSRPIKQLRLEAAQGTAFHRAAADSLGPLTEMMLIASAQLLVGTAGSSFSEQAVAFGGMRVATEQEARGEPGAATPRLAVLFQTPYILGIKGAASGGHRGVPLPESAREANLLCARVKAAAVG